MSVFKKILQSSLVFSQLCSPLHAQVMEDFMKRVSLSEEACLPQSSRDIINLEHLTYLGKVGIGMNDSSRYKDDTGAVFYLKKTENIFPTYVGGKILHCLFPQGFPETILAYDNTQKDRQWYVASREVKHFSPISQKDQWDQFIDINADDMVTWRASLKLLQVNDLNCNNIGVTMLENGHVYPVCVDYDQVFSKDAICLDEIKRFPGWDENNFQLFIEMRAQEICTVSFFTFFLQILEKAIDLFKLQGIDESNFSLWEILSIFLEMPSSHVYILEEGMMDRINALIPDMDQGALIGLLKHNQNLLGKNTILVEDALVHLVGADPWDLTHLLERHQDLLKIYPILEGRILDRTRSHILGMDQKGLITLLEHRLHAFEMYPLLVERALDRIKTFILNMNQKELITMLERRLHIFKVYPLLVERALDRIKALAQDMDPNTSGE